MSTAWMVLHCFCVISGASHGPIEALGAPSNGHYRMALDWVPWALPLPRTRRRSGALQLSPRPRAPVAVQSTLPGASHREAEVLGAPSNGHCRMALDWVPWPLPLPRALAMNSAAANLHAKKEISAGFYLQEVILGALNAFSSRRTRWCPLNGPKRPPWLRFATERVFRFARARAGRRCGSAARQWRYLGGPWEP